ncbi:MAG TPA: TerB family tellurite resistance protein [Myxococcota bacterium]|nr:TerB family tellurite resistance protein [Myxococcota bacterium]
MKLLDRVREFLAKRHPLAKDRTGAEADLELRAATAVLLLEAAYGDEDYAWREHHTIVKGLERDFGLGRREVLELLDRANEIRPPIVKLADVTDVLRERFDQPQREEVAALVRKVVTADNIVEEWEDIFASHIARALGLPPPS